MPTSKYHFCFETPKQSSISDRVHELLDNRFREIPPEIEDEIEELISQQMETSPYTDHITLEEIEEAIRELHDSDQ
jgi:hypothetical protein